MHKWISVSAFISSLGFPAAVLLIGLRNPSVFQVSSFFNVLLFLAIILILITITIFFLQEKSKLLQDNIHGLVLLFSFTISYFLLGNIFNKPNINTNNIYFEADSWSWLRRMAFEDGWSMGVRAIHPFSHIIFRPLVLILTPITGGNLFQANILLLALAGGACVFLMWKIVKQTSGDEIHATLFAYLLGFSASHLIFASVIESYIFSALCLLLFVWLLLKNKSLHLLAVTSTLTFGITITNIIQQGLMELIVRKNFKRTAVLFSVVILAGVAMNLFSKFIYPSTEYVFLPNNFSGEQKFQEEIDLNRAGLMAENLLIYNIAAPQPYTSFRNELPRFNFLNGTIMEYAWFGRPALLLWFAMLGLAFFYFFKKIRSNTVSGYWAIAMLVCLIFNFVLHISYGSELFLYSADWTYALILFTAINLTDFSRRKWFRFMLVALVLSVLINNLWFLYFIARKTGEFLI